MEEVTAGDILSVLCSDGADELLRNSTFRDNIILQPLLELASARETLRSNADILRDGTLYQLALAQGIDGLLQQFYEDVSLVEEDILNDASLSAYHVRSALGPWVTSLPAIARFTMDVKTRALHAGILLNELYARAQDGDAHIAAVFTDLLWKVHQPFFAQIMRWLAFAEVDKDPAAAEDFFVSQTQPLNTNVGRARNRRDGAAVSLSERASPAIVGSNIVDGVIRATGDGDGRTAMLVIVASPQGGKGAGFHTQSPLDMEQDGEGALLNASGVVGSAATASAASLLRDALAEREWTSSYTLVRTRVPTAFFPLALAQTVLGVGKAVRLLTSSGTDSTGGRGSAAMHHAQLQPKGAHDEVLREGAHSKAPSTFSSEDSLAVCALIASLRSSPTYSQLATQVVLHRIRDAVYARLWTAIVSRAHLPAHARALRAFLLLERGDLYTAFLERARPVLGLLQPCLPSALQSVLDGPWAAATVATALCTEFTAVEDHPQGFGVENDEKDRDRLGSDGESEPDLYLEEHGDRLYPPRDAVIVPVDTLIARVSLRQVHRHLRFESPVAVALAVPLETTGEIGDGSSIGGSSWVGSDRLDGGSGVRSGAHACASAHVLRTWTAVSSQAGAETHMRAPRASAQLLLVGAAQLSQVQLSPVHHAVMGQGDSGAERVEEQSIHSVGSIASSMQHKLDRITTLPRQFRDSVSPTLRFTCPRVVLSLPLKARGIPGAAWLTQPVLAVRGFIARLHASLMLPRLPGDGERANSSEPSSPLNSGTGSIAADTITFAFVMHRSLRASLGHGQGQGASSLAGPPAAGFQGILNSVAVQVVCRRLAPRPDQPAGSHPFRCVVAAYGPGRGWGGEQEDEVEIADGQGRDGQSRVGRDLLFPAVAVDISLPLDAVAAVDGSRGGERSALYSLFSALEYCPPGGTAQQSKGRLILSVLASLPETARTPPLITSRPTLVPGMVRSDRLHMRTLFDIPFTLEDVLPMGFVQSNGAYGPGRGRLYLGLTTESTGLVCIAAGQAAVPGPCMAVEALDVSSYSDADGGWAGLHPHYALPWPLHTVLPSAVIATASDVSRFAFKLKSIALGLTDVWRMLMDACTRGEGHGQASFGRGTGVSAQLSGVGGKRMSDPSTLARAGARRRLQKDIRPIFTLRARIAFIVDAIAYHTQVDVIAGACATYEASIESSRSFSAGLQAGIQLANDLGQGTYLDQPSAHACLLRLLNHAERFTYLVLSHSENPIVLVEPNTQHGHADSGARHEEQGSTRLTAELAQVSHSFAADVRYFESGAGSLLALRGPDAGSLVARLNFNGYFNLE